MSTRGKKKLHEFQSVSFFSLSIKDWVPQRFPANFVVFLGTMVFSLALVMCLQWGSLGPIWARRARQRYHLVCFAFFVVYLVSRLCAQG